MSMFYNITSIVLGILLFLNLILSLQKIKSAMTRIVTIVTSIGLIGIGVGGFFIPNEFEYITILVMLVLSILYVIYVYVLIKKAKKTQQTEKKSSK